MTYSPNPKEVEAMFKRKGPERYKYTLRRILDCEQVWSLRNSEGWALFGGNNVSAAMPIWPAEQFAKLCAIEDFSDCVPEMIPLRSFIEEWLSKLDNDNVLIAVLPDTSSNAVVVDARRFGTDLSNEVDRI